MIAALERLSGTRYADGGDAVRSFRVLCDHARGMSAIATDGVTPSNEGRGYVLRRIIRRAVLHGTRLRLETPFLGAVHEAVIESLGSGYPGARASIATTSAACSRPRRSASRRRSRPARACSTT